MEKSRIPETAKPTHLMAYDIANAEASQSRRHRNRAGIAIAQASQSRRHRNRAGIGG
ncbi:MAG: hypothetical protein IJ835_01915 [Muribaculaceae bacterium]|nr:hypothetical protein [Muribaculaceae bacterium]